MTITISELLKDTAYKLTQFSADKIKRLEKSITVSDSRGKNTPYVKCLIRNKEIKLTPEEAIRQLYLMVLIEDFGYPTNRMELEYSVTFGREKKTGGYLYF
jgi:type I restriction enzyme M protein